MRWDTQHVGNTPLSSKMITRFNDLLTTNSQLQDEIDAAVVRVLHSGRYILGAEVNAFEAAFAAYHGIGHAVGVASGTDAIELALRAAGIESGDEVITVAHTAVPTICAIERAGAIPVLVDVEAQTYTMDPEAVRAALTPRTRAILPVHLYGQPADMVTLSAIAQGNGLLLIEDCAQAHGARLNGQLVGTFGDLAAFSFYPTKNLGGVGDGGAVLTNDAGYAEKLRRLRNYGQVSRYDYETRGVNSRLDELQAAVLRVKLPHLDEQNATRRRLARRYDAAFADQPAVITPEVRAGAEPVYHLYVVRTAGRDALMQRLSGQGVQTLIHYAVPVHLQAAYADLGYRRGDLAVTERICGEILSLPMHSGLSGDQVEMIAKTVIACLGSV
jgi:dTDP-3-amino-3,4,6-trideoxy-alpha-D-glucose transaminase